MIKEIFIDFWNDYLKPALKARELERKIILLEKEIYEQKMLIKKLQTQLAKLKGENKEENYWNNKWEKNTIRYKAQGNYYRDVRTLLCDKSYILEDIINKYNLVGNTNDLTVYNILWWVIKNIKYKHDDVNFGEIEYWAHPEILVQKKLGDCDDFALLIKSMMLIAKIPDWRAKVCAGWVKSNGDKGGHAYVIYLRESDNEWCILDGTYHCDLTPIDKRIKHKDDNRYLDIWWTFSKEYCFSPRTTTIK